MGSALNIRHFFLGSVFLVLVIFDQTEAQIIFQYDSSVRVIENGSVLQNPWSGGLNSGQYNKFDFNGDGLEDLIIYDRSSDQLNPFLYSDEGYLFHPAYRSSFPEDISGWMLLRDYDCDGRKDLFANTERGMKVYRNITSSGGLPEWDLVADPLLTLTNSGLINLQVNLTDIPAIDDIDGDGDLDILVYNFALGGFIRFHKNMSMERSGSCGSLDYELISRNWGYFEECECYYAFQALGESCSDPQGGRVMHPGGKTMLLIDMDNDGDKDFIGGHEQCVELFYLENDGTPDEALMTDYADTFPDADHPARMYIHPAAYHEDIDQDGKKDLMVAPNEQDNVGFGINFSSSSWFYRNIGSNEFPDFSFVTDRFLQSGMIDLGENAAPSLVDIDGDADLDLVVGGNGKPSGDTFVGYVRVYENTGNAVNPIFELIEDDYLDISTLEYVNAVPVFADLDHDGAIDMIITMLDPNSGTVISRWYGNEERPGRGLQFDPFNYEVLPLELRGNDTPYFTDINGDGLNDLLIGKASGRLEYYVNAGTKNNPFFRLEDAAYLGIDDDFITFKRNLVPFVADFDLDGRKDLLTTDYTGTLTVYAHFQENPEKSLEVILNPLTGVADTSRFGYHYRLAGGCLISGQYPVLLAGTDSGGILFFKNPTENSGGEDDILTFRVFPNPYNRRTPLHFLSGEDGEIYIYNMLGQLLAPPVAVEAFHTRTVDPIFIRQGIYLIRLVSKGGRSQVHQLVVH